MPEKKLKYPANVTHTERYYLACLLIFLAGLKENLTQAQIAMRLNEADLKTPQGLPWEASTLKQVLKRLRLNRDYRSSFHSALLRLVYAGQLSVKQVQPLFTLRVTGVQ